MKRELNPELDRIILDHLAQKYKLLEARVGVHLSTLNYCLTKGFWDLNCPINPSDTELLNFATGYGLQEVMFPASTDSNSGGYFEKEGIVYRPDGMLPVRLDGLDRLVEIKSTRSGAKRYQEGQLPETWITYMKGGCYIRGVTTYDLGVIYLSERPSAKIISETISFTEDEILSNWTWIKSRYNLYKNSIDTNTPVTPFTTAPSWMCDNCRYKMTCDAIIMMKGKI
jgi:hypothetical protein